MAAVLFASLVSILIIGFLWFFVARPILEDFGLLPVNDYQEAPPVVMSRPEQSALANAASSLQTDTAQAQTDTQPSGPTPEQYLTLFRALREAGIKREDIRPILKGVGLKLDNNLWAQAAPPPPPHETPIAGRPTAAAFRDPDYPYQELS